MKKLLSFLLILSTFWGFSQSYCAFDDINDFYLKDNHEAQQKLDKFEALWRKIQSDPNKNARVSVKDGKTIYEIPIVVHVFHTGNPEGGQYNRSDREIEDWIERVNDVYSTKAPDIPGPENGGTIIPIRLVLAKRTPDNLPTNGINRINGATIWGDEYTDSGIDIEQNGGINLLNLYNASRWDPSVYYNIYVVNKFNGVDGENGGVMGFAFLPESGNALDGSVMVSATVRENDNTFPHELGHALGLYHPFQGGDENSCPPETGDCLVDNDKVCDTEPTKSLLSVWPCPTDNDINTCTGQPYQGVQNNIMNYGYCLNKFTKGQRERMLTSIIEYRLSLVNSKAQFPPSNDDDLGELQPACTPNNIANPWNQTNSGPSYVGLANIDFESQGYNPLSSDFYINKAQDYDLANHFFTELYTGHSYDLHIGSKNNNYGVAYIDFNNDGVFDETTEKIFDRAIINTIESREFSIPENAVKNTLLRLRVFVDSSKPDNACSNLKHGQVEDYSVIIKDKLQSPIIVKEKNSIGINTDSPQATLDISSDTQGVLFPRLTKVQIKNIQSPKDGMMVYDLDSHCLAIYNTLEQGGEWKCIRTKKINF